ncbi:MAG: hypothetical protein IJC58_05855 [Oscillospiraceae bacterium]|nr:hypothetical protein [Oscillospiraceae bacterium]
MIPIEVVYEYPRTGKRDWAKQLLQESMFLTPEKAEEYIVSLEKTLSSR